MTHYCSRDESIGRVPIRGRAWGGREIAGRISCFRALPSRHQRSRSIFLIAAMCAFAQGPSAAETTSPWASAIGGDTAAGILAESGFPGGLCVHLGSTDGELEAALAQDGRFLVHGLTLSEEACERSRAAVRAKNLYGIAGVERMQSLGVLPYADNLVNVIIVEVADLGNQAPAQDEVLRVLCPNGLALLRKPDGVRFFVGGYELVSESIGKKSGGAPKPASVLSTPSFGLNNAILPLISFSTRYGEWTKCGLQGVSGNILVHDKKRICSIRQGAGKQPSELQVFARSQDGTVGQTPVWRDNSGDADRIRAMTLAGHALVVACRGEAGTSGLLRIRSLADGSPRGELVLPAAPVLHGLAVVDGGIVVVMDGYRVLKVGAR